MRLPKECYQMRQVIETHLPHLTQAQLTGLAWWVCGTILAGSACQNAVASALSTRDNWNNLRQYLREWLYDGGDRARPCKTELDVSLCFAPLLRWVLAWWCSGRLAPAVDPTLKGDDTTAIVISVVYRGCAIPVAWRILRANKRGAWMDPIVELLQALAPAVPRGNDRGGAVRPGLGQSEIVETDTCSGLASLHEVSEKRHFLRRERTAAARASLRSPSGYRADRERDRLRGSRRKTPLHPAGGLVRGTGGAVDHPDRPSTGGSRGELVRAPLLDRVGVQGAQEPGLAMAEDP